MTFFHAGSECNRRARQLRSKPLQLGLQAELAPGISTMNVLIESRCDFALDAGVLPR
jgi:hypothetical protein